LLSKEAQDFVKGSLRMMVLRAIKEKELHGYALMQYIRKKTGKYYGPSTIYPMLIGMERDGFIESKWELHARPRKVHCITQKGLGELRHAATEIAFIVQHSDILEPVEN